MGDLRFERAYRTLRDARDRSDALRALPDVAVLQALAAGSRFNDPQFVGMIAGEAMARLARLRDVLATIREGVLALGTRGEVTWLNPAAETLLGIERVQAVRTPMRDLVEHLDARHQPIVADRDPITRALTMGVMTKARGEYFRGPEGREICASYACSPFFDDIGGVAGAVLAFHDCAKAMAEERELRKSHEIYRTLFEHSPVPTIRIAPNGTVIDANQAALDVARRAPSDLVGLSFGSFVHSDDQNAAADLFARVLMGRRGEIPLRVLQGDGNFVETTARAIPAIVEGEIIGIHGILEVHG